MGSTFFNAKNILIISPERWDQVFVSKHHYAIELGTMGNKVFFLNPPSTKFMISSSGYENVSVIDYRIVVKGVRYMPALLQKIIFTYLFKKLEATAGKVFDLVWSFDNSVFFDFSFLKRRTTMAISHIVDYTQNFEFETSSRTASLCLGVAQNIVDRQKRYNSNAFLIPHGISTALYTQQKVELPGNNPVKAVYIGNLDNAQLDREMLVEMVNTFRHIDFVFIGPYKSKMTETSNSYYLGKVRKELLLNYLQEADVLLCVYNQQLFPDQVTTSHKLLEYFIAGKVMVSNYFPAYEDKKHLMVMATAREEIKDLFDYAIKNLATLNSSELVLQRRDFAYANTYSMHLAKIETLLTQLQHHENK